MWIGLTARANGDPVEDFLKEFEARRGKVNTFSGHFVQKRTLSVFGETKISTGKVLYKAPRRMMWKYSEPDQTQMLIGPDSVAFYFPELEQIEIYPAGKGAGASDFFFAFEASGDELKENFDVSIGLDEEKLKRVDLFPKAESLAAQLRGLTLWLDPSDYLPRKIWVNEISGDKTEIELSGIQVNEPIPDNELELDAPEGTNIIKNDPGSF